MSLVITTDVFCDSCGDWVHGSTGKKPKGREARKNAQTQGWTRSKSGGRVRDLCPRCSKGDEL